MWQRRNRQKKSFYLENEKMTFADTIARTLRFFDDIPSPAIRLNLDPGNYASQRDPTTPDAYEIFYERGLVAHMHVKDMIHRFPIIGGFFGIVGKGRIDYSVLFKQAIDNQYSGYFSLETHAHSNKEAISIASLKNMIAMLQKFE